MKVPFLGKSPEPALGPTGEMTLLGHLTELRTRLIRSLIAVSIGVAIVFMLSDRIFGVLEGPYCDFQAKQNKSECSFLVLEPLEPFRVVLTLSGWGGLILALPVVLYQLGRFILPGLYPNERRALLPFLGASVVLLFGGMSVAFLLIPKALEVLLEFGPDSFDPQFTADKYLGFFVKMLFAFGVAAELPLVLIFLQKIGVVSNETLRKNRRVAAVAVVILGAIITPTGDPFILAAISVPMYFFYELAILIGRRMKAQKSPVGEEVGV